LWQAWKAERRIKMVYQWKSNSRIKVNADVAGQMCEQIEKEKGLTAQTLLDANRAEGTPLHNEFEWNDSIAAEEYRLQQARHIINCLCIKTESKKEQPVRAFFKISDAESYENINVIVSSEDKYGRLLDTAMKELIAFETKYSSLTELSPVFKAIDNIKEAI
jgi:hypothetical protein